MPTQKPRIQAILEKEVYNKFKMLCEIEDRTESKLASRIITEYVQNYEKQNGIININSGNTIKLKQEGDNNTINIS